MKKLLVFTENYARGGGNRYMIDLINSVINDVNALILASNGGGVFPEELARLKSTVHCRDFFFITRARVRQRIQKLPRKIRGVILLPFILFAPILFGVNFLAFIFYLKQIKPDGIVSCNGGYPASRACLSLVVAAKILKIPVLLTIVSMPTQRKKLFNYFSRKFDAYIWSAVNAVIVNAKAIQSALCHTRGMPIGLSKVIYNGLRDIPVNMEAHTHTKPWRIGCVARMDASKGVLYLLDAFAMLASHRSDVHLILAGEGDASVQLSERTRKLGLDKQVHLLGHVSSAIHALMMTFDIYIFPSLWEGLPYSVVEAMRAGCVIVATDVGGISELIKNGQEGLLIPPGSIDGILEAVQRLMAEPVLCERLRNNARKKYEMAFSLEKMHSLLRDSVMNLLSLKTVPNSLYDLEKSQ